MHTAVAQAFGAKGGMVSGDDPQRDRRRERAVLEHPELASSRGVRDTAAGRDPRAETEPAAMRAIVGNIRFLLGSEFAEDLSGAATEDPTLSYRIERRVLELLGDAEATPMSAFEHQRVVDDVIDDLLALGPLQPLMDDPMVTEILVNGPHQVYAERSGVYVSGRRDFDDEAQLRDIIDRMLGAAGLRLDPESPLVEARLPDGARVNVVLPPLAVDGTVLTVRKYAHDSFSAEDLISFGTLDENVADFLARCVRGRLNILVSGDSGAGRTTLLNVLGGWVPEDDRVVTIEDAAELRLPQTQVVRLESRAADVEGRGGVGLRELVNTALRLHGDRFLVGEVQGYEAFDMLLAMGAGHDGWMSTVYACSPADALARFETLALLGSGPNTPAATIRSQVSEAFDLVVHLERLRDGTRRVVEVAEVGDPSDEGITVRALFEFDPKQGLDSTGRLRGRLVPTGLLPVFSHRLAGQDVSPAQLGLGLH